MIVDDVMIECGSEVFRILLSNGDVPRGQGEQMGSVDGKLCVQQ